MEQQARVINIMRTMTANSGIDLECCHRVYKDITKLYRGRPEMLVMKMTNGRNVQLFRGGKIQILGRHDHEVAEEMRRECIEKLRKIEKMANLQVSAISIVNMVVKFQLRRPICLRKIRKSDAHLFYEVELFPAALLTKWRPIHIALFHNGQVIVTGIKSLDQVTSIMKNLNDYLSQITLCK